MGKSFSIQYRVPQQHIDEFESIIDSLGVSANEFAKTALVYMIKKHVGRNATHGTGIKADLNNESGKAGTDQQGADTAALAATLADWE